MKIGFIGLPKSGKTTLFNALTGSSAVVSAYSTARVGPNIASVKVGDSRVAELSAIYRPKRTVYPTIDIVDLAGEFEMELSRLDEESARAFMEDLGITASARDRLTALAYDALGYISFFTVGEDEVRAWNIRRDATAVEAAAAIHSDLARGFIAAECFRYEDLVAWGSEKVVKEKGRFLVAGKDYSVKDGDILSIRFNV